MAYLTETATWGAGIYQIEMVDPISGGPNGIINLPMKEAANRLVYLKAYADEVKSARGTFANLKARFESLTPIDEQTHNATMGMLLEAIGIAGMANREVLKEHTQRKQTGVVLLTNKGIISGCTVTKSPQATRNLSCSSGVIFAKGQLLPFSGETDGAAVPSNGGQSSQTCYAYLYFKTDGTLEFTVTELGKKVPDEGIPLYLITVPSGNNEQNDAHLSSVTLSSVRRMEANFPTFFSTALYANVSLPYVLPDANYSISLDIISIDGSGFQRGEVYPMDRNTNGFKIYYNGVADDLLIRWEISKPSL